jgi:hypothetical protein
MFKLVLAASLLLVVGCAAASPSRPTSFAEPLAIVQVREALRLSGVTEEVAGAPMATLAIAGPDGASLVVAERARWWVRPDGLVRPADVCAERLSEELLSRAH